MATPEIKTFTREEVEKHNKPDDLVCFRFCSFFCVSCVVQ